MDLFEAIGRRYSYRGAFKDQPLRDADLRKILEAGLKAPSGKNAETTEFVAVTDQDVLTKIGSMHTMKAMHDAKAMILCIVDKRPEAVYEGYDFQVEDLAAAVENMFLAATALGYATVWIDGWLRLEKRAEIIAERINLPKNKVIRILLPLGVPVEDGPRKEKKLFEERVSFNVYGGGPKRDTL